jgi:hypothetical protein
MSAQDTEVRAASAALWKRTTAGASPKRVSTISVPEPHPHMHTARKLLAAAALLLTACSDAATPLTPAIPGSQPAHRTLVTNPVAIWKMFSGPGYAIDSVTWAPTQGAFATQGFIKRYTSLSGSSRPYTISCNGGVYTRSDTNDYRVTCEGGTAWTGATTFTLLTGNFNGFPVTGNGSGGLVGMDSARVYYRSTFIPPVHADGLTGHTNVYSAGTETYTAQVSGGDGLSFVWEMLPAGSSTWQNLGVNSQTLTQTFTAGGSYSNRQYRYTVSSLGKSSTSSPISVTVANPLYTQPSVSIMGPMDITTLGTNTWVAATTGGNGTYTYEWYISYADHGGVWYTLPETGGTLSLDIDAQTPNFQLEVVVHSGNLGDVNFTAVTNSAGCGGNDFC